MPINDIQSTNKQHAVPQNVLDVEFKIIGELTMRQFFYLMIFGALGYAAFITLDNIFKWPLVLICALAGVALAFLPIEERGLDQWIINFIKAMYGDSQFIWRKTPEVSAAFSFQGLAMVKQELITLAPATSRRKLEEFLEVQKTQVVRDPLDIQESVYIQKVRDAFYEEPVAYTTAGANIGTGVGVGVTVDEPILDTTVTAPPIDMPTTAGVTPTTNLPPANSAPAKATDTPTDTNIPGKVSPAQSTQPPKPTKSEIPITAVIAKPPIKRPLMPTVQQQEIKLKAPTYQPLEPITPDRHSGRKFTNLLPQQGEIVLPIRGELTLNTSEESEIETDIQEKATQLKKLLDQIKREEGVEEKTVQQPTQETPLEIKLDDEKVAEQTLVLPQAQNVTDDVQTTLKKLQEENLKLTQQIEALRQEINKTNAPQERTQKIATLQKLQEEKTKTTQNYSTIKESLQDLKEKVFVKQAIHEPAQYIQDTSDKKANVIEGTVETPEGAALEGVVLIIKNDKEEPVRAVKTNPLGKFAVSTPLANGLYTIETDKSNKTDYSFDIINVTAMGSVLNEFKIVGKRKI